MKERLSLRDLAAKLGLSHTAVSLALRNDSRIPPATCRRVRQAAARLGYKADATVSRLMGRLRTLRTKPVRSALGLITAWPTRQGWKQSPNLRRFAEGAAQRAKELGYSLDDFWLTEPGMSSDRLTQILLSRDIEGLILQSLPHVGGELELDWRHFACVTKGLTISRPRAHRVVSSHYEDMAQVMLELAKRGYRRIGLVLSEALSQRVDRARLANYLVHQHDLSSRDRLPTLIMGGGDAAALFSRWLERHAPEVILFSDQPVGEWCERLRLRIPGDLGLVHLDWSPGYSQLAGWDSNSELMGFAAVDLLVGQLQANEFGVPEHEKIVAVRGRWREGASVRETPETAPTLRA